MHVLGNIGHGFSQRRKTPKPKDLHIRKVSFSGSSLSSGSSFSSSSSTLSASSTCTARAPPASARTVAGSLSPGRDPLSSHPTFQPPPRLHERPLISPERCRYQPASTFFDDSTDDSTDDEHDLQSMDEDEGEGEDEYTVGKAQALLHSSHASETTLDCAAQPSDAQDYFMLPLPSKRPSMPRSRWSESTIQTLDQDLDLDMDLDLDVSTADDLDEAPDCEAVPAPLEMPNFSHKRSVSTPKRPPMRSLDSLEDLIKRSGWKRRGVVFNETETGGDLSPSSW